MTEQQTLLVAQVLTLASALEAADKANPNVKAIGVNYERRAVELIHRRAADVLQLLSAARQS
jgi:hypothetical protein